MFQAGHPVACLEPDGAGLLLGTDGGEVIALRPDAAPAWRARLPGAIRCVAGTGPECGSVRLVLAGFGERGLWIGDGNGKTLRQFEFPYRETAWPWCQSRTAGAAAAVGVQHEGIPCFVVGTGDGYLHLYDPDGRERWYVLFPSLGVPGTLRVVRYGRSPEPRILAAPRLKSNRPHIMLLDGNGTSVAFAPMTRESGGPLAAFDLAAGAGRVLVAGALDKDPNLQVFDLARLDDLAPYPYPDHVPATASAMDPRRFGGCRLWDRSLGGGATGVVVDAGAQRVYAVTDLGFAAAHGLDGARLWQRLFPMPLACLVRVGGRLIASDGAGSLIGFSASGAVSDAGAVPGLTRLLPGGARHAWALAGNQVLRMEEESDAAAPA